MLALVILVLYVVATLALGYWGMKRTRNVGDFLLGGRTIGPWMSAFAYGTTYFSAVLFVGYAGKLGWGFGHYTIWIVIGNTIVGSLLAWLVLARRTRRVTTELEAITMPQFLEARYDSKFLRILAAIVTFIFLVPYSGSVYMGLSYLFESVAGIPYVAALTLMAVLTGVYLIMGGYFALTLTDFLRGIVEIVGAAIMLVVLVTAAGGLPTVLTRLDAVQLPGFNAINLQSAIPGVPSFAGPGWLVLAALVIVTSVGPWGMPQMVQKFYSIKSEHDATRAMIAATAFALIISFCAYMSGALSHLFFSAVPIDPSTGAPSVDLIMPKLIVDQVPWGIALLILLLVFSASMSSLSSLVLVSSSAIAIDIYQAQAKPTPSNRQVVTLMRILCGVFIAASLAIALYRPAFILSLMVISWGAIGGSFIAPYVYGLFMPRVGRAVAIAAMILGLGTSMVLYVAWGEPGVPIAGAIALIVPIVVTPILGLLSDRKESREPVRRPT